jgi:hypothetical protein
MAVMKLLCETAMATQENCVRATTGGCQKKIENGTLHLDLSKFFKKMVDSGQQLV